ncbi:hypothetical protein ACFSX9_07010 [Flavobacterium ardleyense]|uniref:Lipoprotein n=1 Tax=Flavobacterium ardleyense TaxID=2038737 RepID=A0ABW5Z6Y8_9FLAO
MQSIEVMRNMLSLITIFIFCISCKVSEKSTITKEHYSTLDLNSNQGLIGDSLNPYVKFEALKEAVKLKLEKISSAESNVLYEEYLNENSELEARITDLEQPILDKYHSQEEVDKSNLENLLTKLLENELELKEDEDGNYTIKTVFNFYYNLFHKYVTDDYKDYLYLKSEENKEIYEGDASLNLTFTELGDRIIDWEKFIKKYPESKLSSQVKDQIARYQIDYLLGLDNTPTTEKSEDPEKRFIYQENIEEFNRFIKIYPNSPTVKLILLYQANFKNSDAIDLIRKEQEK